MFFGDVTHYISGKRTLCSSDIGANTPSKVICRYQTPICAQNESRLCFLDLSPEVQFMILDAAELKSLSCFVLVSKATRDLCFNYLRSPTGTKRLVSYFAEYRDVDPYVFANTLDTTVWLANKQIFTSAGFLLKRITCLYATRDRLKIFEEFIARMDISSQDLMSNCIIAAIYGHILRVFTSGWEPLECTRAFNQICFHRTNRTILLSIISKRLGTFRSTELQARLFYRNVFIDQPNMMDRERAFWLSRILADWPMVYQARILVLLFSPADPEEIMWDMLCDWAPRDADESVHWFGRLGTAINYLNQHSAEWNIDDIASVFEEIIATPDDWLAENVAHLLVHSGRDVRIRVLCSKAINMRLVDLSILFAHAFVVYKKLNLPLEELVSDIKVIVQLLPNDKARSKSHLLRLIADVLKDLLLEFFAYDDGDDDIAGFRHILGAIHEMLSLSLQCLTGISPLPVLRPSVPVTSSDS